MNRFIQKMNAASCTQLELKSVSVQFLQKLYSRNNIIIKRNTTVLSLSSLTPKHSVTHSDGEDALHFITFHFLCNHTTRGTVYIIFTLIRNKYILMVY